MSVPNPCLNASATEETPISDSKLFPEPLKIEKNNVPSYFLNSSNVQKLYKEDVILDALRNVNMVHKVLIQNTNNPCPKLDILKAFTKQVAPHLIVIFDIKIEGKNITFYCKNCHPALELLCKIDNLMLKYMIKGVNILLPITLILAVNNRRIIHASPRNILVTMLGNRILRDINVPTNVNLQNFDKIKGMGTTIYIDISLPSALNYVLNLLKPFNIKVLNLSHNNIQTLRGWRRPFFLDSIDLSHNNIKSLDDIAPLINKVKKKIDLSGNPVINEFPSIEKFYQKLQELYPTLDNENDNEEPIIKPIWTPIPERNFSVSEEAVYLVDQFMEHFFRLYDRQENRKHLIEMYHSKAIFSLTSNIVNEQNRFPQSSLRYKHHAHNILIPESRTDFAVGPSEIIKKLTYLPATYHDGVSFCVDILHYVEDQCCMFTITGLFCLPTNRSFLYSFSRTFTLLAGHKGEFFIANDLLNVSNCPLRLQNAKAKKRKYARNVLEMQQVIPPAITAEAKNGFTVILIEVTGLHADSARNLLEESQWNIREALKTFVHNLRFGKISRGSFMQEEVKEVVIKDLPRFCPGMNKKKLGTMLKNMENLKDAKYFWTTNINKQLFLQELKQMLENEN